MHQVITTARQSPALNERLYLSGGGRSLPDEFYPKPPSTEPHATPPVPSETPPEVEPCGLPSSIPEQVPEPKQPVIHPTQQPEVPNQ